MIGTLEAQTAATLRELQGVSEEQSLYRYAPGKWSLRESWLHVVDTERIFTYRMLRFARKDPTDLSSFDQDVFIGPSEADSRNWASIVEEWQAVRGATLQLFRNLPAAAWGNAGTVGGNTMSARGMAYATAGHELHHVKLLQERYRNQ
ncbi:hypothetical protein F183_A35050 [Bryobacterales bacterium F-183]|nr:hypothetical protein F183_A35050 [Bryobacterales bacterium F-183]